MEFSSENIQTQKPTALLSQIPGFSSCPCKHTAAAASPNVLTIRILFSSTTEILRKYDDFKTKHQKADMASFSPGR